jgi:hypothetical protein
VNNSNSNWLPIVKFCYLVIVKPCYCTSRYLTFNLLPTSAIFLRDHDSSQSVPLLLLDSTILSNTFSITLNQKSIYIRIQTIHHFRKPRLSSGPFFRSNICSLHQTATTCQAKQATAEVAPLSVPPQPTTGKKSMAPPTTSHPDYRAKANAQTSHTPEKGSPRTIW